LLSRTQQLRVPEAPWQWSVLDGRGREWWGRLRQEHKGRFLLLQRVGDAREHRLPWAEGMSPPASTDLRRLVEAA
jgi:hypothetical protein